MNDESRNIAEMVRSGAYFEQSRAWLQSVYLAPIAERTFFLIVAILAGLIAFTGVTALFDFMPLVETPGLLIRNARVEDTWLRAEPLRRPGMTINESIRDFFIRAYVEKREAYEEGSYAANYNFVLAQSDTPMKRAFMALYDPRNPDSPAAILGYKGKQNVTIQDVRVNTSSEPHTATVRFTTQLEGLGDQKPVRWVAKMGFYYTDMQVFTAVDAVTGAETLLTQDPQFQVVSYELEEADKK